MIEYLVAMPLSIIPLLIIVWIIKSLSDLARETRYLISELNKTKKELLKEVRE